MSQENVEIARRLYSLADQGDDRLWDLLPAEVVEVEAHVWNVWRFSGRKPVEWTYFGEDRATAFEAAGLPE